MSIGASLAAMGVAPAPASPAAAAESACDQFDTRIRVVILLDTSGSLRQTDPDNRRVAGALGAIDIIRRIAADNPETEFEVTVDTFDTIYHRGSGWVSVSSARSTERLDEAVAAAAVAEGSDTDYREVFTGVVERFRESSAADSVCGFLFWFTDGDHDTDNVSRTLSATERQEIDDLCRAGGPVDELRQLGVDVTAIELRVDRAPSPTLSRLVGQSEGCLGLRGESIGEVIDVGSARDLERKIQDAIPPVVDEDFPDVEPTCENRQAGQCEFPFTLLRNYEWIKVYIDLTEIDDPADLEIRLRPPDGGEGIPVNFTNDWAEIGETGMMGRVLSPSRSVIWVHLLSEIWRETSWDAQTWVVEFFGPEGEKAAAATTTEELLRSRARVDNLEFDGDSLTGVVNDLESVATDEILVVSTRIAEALHDGADADFGSSAQVEADGGFVLGGIVDDIIKATAGSTFLAENQSPDGKRAVPVEVSLGKRIEYGPYDFWPIADSGDVTEDVVFCFEPDRAVAQMGASLSFQVTVFPCARSRVLSEPQVLARDDEGSSFPVDVVVGWRCEAPSGAAGADGFACPELELKVNTKYSQTWDFCFEFTDSPDPALPADLGDAQCPDPTQELPSESTRPAPGIPTTGVAPGAAPTEPGGLPSEGAAPTEPGGLPMEGAAPTEPGGLPMEGAAPTEPGGLPSEGAAPGEPGQLPPEDDGNWIEASVRGVLPEIATVNISDSLFDPSGKVLVTAKGGSFDGELRLEDASASGLEGEEVTVRNPRWVCNVPAGEDDVACPELSIDIISVEDVKANLSLDVQAETTDKTLEAGEQDSYTISADVVEVVGVLPRNVSAELSDEPFDPSGALRFAADGGAFEGVLSVEEIAASGAGDAELDVQMPPWECRVPANEEGFECPDLPISVLSPGGAVAELSVRASLESAEESLSSPVQSSFDRQFVATEVLGYLPSQMDAAVGDPFDPQGSVVFKVDSGVVDGRFTVGEVVVSPADGDEFTVEIEEYECEVPANEDGFECPVLELEVLPESDTTADLTVKGEWLIVDDDLEAPDAEVMEGTMADIELAVWDTNVFLAAFLVLLAGLLVLVAGSRTAAAWRRRRWAPISYPRSYSAEVVRDSGGIVTTPDGRGLMIDPVECGFAPELAMGHSSALVEGVQLKIGWLPLLLGKDVQIVAISTNGECVANKGSLVQKDRRVGLVGSTLRDGWVIETLGGRNRLVFWDVPSSKEEAQARLDDILNEVSSKLAAQRSAPREAEAQQQSETFERGDSSPFEERGQQPGGGDAQFDRWRSPFDEQNRQPPPGGAGDLPWEGSSDPFV